MNTNTSSPSAKSKIEKFKELYPKNIRIQLLLVFILILTYAMGFPTYSPSIAFIFSLYFIYLIFSPFTERNIFTLMTLHLIINPVFVTLVSWGILIFLFKESSNSFIVFYPLYALPFISTFYVMLDYQHPKILERVKVALEYNNAFFVLITGGLAVYSFSTSDFSKLNPLASSSSYISNGFNTKDGFDFLISIFGLPFLVANAFTKAFIEHRLYRVALKGNSTNLVEPSNGDNVEEGNSSSEEVRINEPKPVRTAKVKKQTKVKQVSQKKQPPLEK